MATNVLRTPVVVDGILSDEKIAELLALQAEYPELDYKVTIDLTTTEDKVELAKDVGAMQVRGGYILGGADNHGALTGGLDGVDPRPFDEANLTPRLRRWLPEPLELRTRVAERDGHTVVAIYVGPRRRVLPRSRSPHRACSVRCPSGRTPPAPYPCPPPPFRPARTTSPSNTTSSIPTSPAMPTF